MSSDNVEVVLDQTNIEVTHTGGSTIQISTQTEPQNVEIALAGIAGATGPANSLSIGDVTTGAPGTSADADITGTSPSQTLNLIIPRGDTGDTGPTGPTGPANVLTVGTVTQLSPVSTPTIGITGTSPSQTVNFGIPAGAKILTGTAAPAGGTGLQGDWYINTTTSDLYEKTGASTWTLRSNIKGATGATGNTGATGPANQLTVDSVTASAPGSTPVVTIGGAAPTQTISFVLPRGDTGPIGPAPNLAIGTVTTVAPGGTATADVTGTNPNYVINLGIPRGDKGEIGAQWITGSAAPTSGIGVEGDFYLVTGLVGLGDVYEKTDATTWTLQGNIRGAAGNGDVNAVNSVLPDVNGNVLLTWGDFTGTIPESALPAQAISDTFTVASEAAMLALTAQRGDYAIRTDEGSTYILTAEPASTLSNWTLFRVNASNITTGTLPMGVIPTGTTGTSVALGNHGHSLTDANITGIIPNAKLPARLGNPEVEAVTDWDNALEPGFYYGSGTALNSPAAYATVGLVTRGANANNITQRLTAQADGNDAEFIRKRSAGVWGAWETTMSKTSTLDARYAQIVNAVMLTGAQTIAGVKTFSSSPIVPTPSAGTDATNKTYVDAGLGGKANTAHNHDTGAITTGTMDIARLPTGTTGTTVALGNHLHTGVYEPVIAAGTTSQYRRGDNTWRDLGLDALLLTGNQTVGGVKTFSSTPVAPAYSTNTAGMLPTDRPEAYPLGWSYFVVSAAGAGWPEDLATVETLGIGASRGYQKVIGKTSGRVWVRAADQSVDDGWTAWTEITGGDKVLLTGAQTIAGDKTFTGLLTVNSGITATSAGGRLLTLRHTTNVADGLVLVNNEVGQDQSPRAFFVSTGGGNSIFRQSGTFIISTGATAGSSSGTARITLADSGNVTFTNSIDVNGNVAIGSGSLTTAQLSNTATNPIAIGTGSGVNTAEGFLWRVNGVGWAANISNASTASAADGLLVGTASTNAATGLFQLDSGTTNKFKIMGDGYLEHLSEITLGSVAGNYAISRKYRHAGGVNNFQLVDMMHRTGAGSDWVTAEIYQGIGIDSSYLTPTTIRTYIRRAPNGQNMGFGSGGAEWMTLSNSSAVVNNPLFVYADYIQLAKASTGYIYAKIGNTSTGGAGIVIDGKDGNFTGLDYAALVQENAGDFHIRNYAGDTKVFYSSNSTPTATFGNGTLVVANSISTGAITATGLISTQKPIIDWNGVSTTSQWQKSAQNIVLWTSTSGVETGELMFDTNLPNTLNVMITLHVKGYVHAAGQGVIDLIIKGYYTASGTMNTIQVLNNGTFPIDFVRFYNKTATGTLSISIDTPNADWDWAKVWVDGYFGHSTLVTDAQLDGWTSAIVATPTSSGYTSITSASPSDSVRADTTQTISGVKTFSSLITGTAGVSTGGVLTVPGTSYQTFGASGVGAPTFTTRSVGTKIVLYEGLGASAADYALGIDGSTLWSSVPSSTGQFKWYAGTTNIATISGAGNLSVIGNVTVGTDIKTTAGSGIIRMRNDNATASTVEIYNDAGNPAILFHNPSDYYTKLKAEADGLHVREGADTYYNRMHAAAFVESSAAASGTSGTVTLNCQTNAVYTLTPTAAVTTLTLSNAPASGRACTVTLVVSQGATAYTIATPTGGVWYGAQPTQVANKKCVFTYMTYDAGTTWHCSGAVQA